MNPEILISKYLDGELTADEDQKLRALVNSNETVKRKFDTAVQLHLAMLDDSASILPPSDLVRETEDLVMMKIINRAPVEIRYKPVLFTFRRYAAAAMLLIGMMTFIYGIDDSLIKPGLGVSEITNEIINTKDSNYPIITKSDKNNSLNDKSGKIKNSVNAIAGMMNSSVNTTATELNAIDNSSPVPGSHTTGNLDSYNSNANDAVITPRTAEIENASKPVNDFNANIDDKPANKNQDAGKGSVNMLSTSLGNIPEIGGLNQNFGQFTKSAVELNSMFATDFITGGFKTNDVKVISSFSQSLSFRLDEHNNIGMEIGFSEFSYDDRAFMTAPRTGPPDNGNAGVGGSGDFIRIPVDVNKTMQLIWGAAFYERKLPVGEMIVFSARASVGFTNDGMTASGRVAGEMKILSGLYLVAGLQSKAFNAKMYNDSDNESQVKSSVSAIYGLRFSF